MTHTDDASTYADLPARLGDDGTNPKRPLIRATKRAYHALGAAM